MMKKYLSIMLSVLLSGTTAQALDLVDDMVYIESLGMRPGDVRYVEVFMDNVTPWITVVTEIELPKGLEFELITPDEVDDVTYTMTRVFDQSREEWDDYAKQSYAAMSCSFQNPDFIVHDSHYDDMVADKRLKGWYRELYATLKSANKLSITISDIDMKTSILGGEHLPIALIKVKATDEFIRDENTVTVTLPVLTQCRTVEDSHTGQTTEVQVNYEGRPNRAPAKWRNVDIVDVNRMINVMLAVDGVQRYNWYDNTSDGTVDIADINGIINEMLGKTGYDVPTGNKGHDTAPAKDSTQGIAPER